MLVYRREGGRQIFLPRTTRANLIDSVGIFFQNYRLQYILSPSSNFFDLLTIVLDRPDPYIPTDYVQSPQKLQEEVLNIIWGFLQDRWVQYAQFLEIKVIPHAELPPQPFVIKTITQQADLWPFLEAQLRPYCPFNAEFVLSKLYPRPPIDRRKFQMVLEYYEAVAPYIVAACADRELTIVRLNPETENGFPLRIQRNFKDIYGDETLRKRIVFRTSDRFLEFVHALKILAIIPNCHRELPQTNYPDYLAIDFDPWVNVRYEEVHERLQDYARYLLNYDLQFYVTSSGRRSFHIYIPVAPWTDFSVIFPQATQFERFLERRKADLPFIAARDALDLLTIDYARGSQIGPVVPRGGMLNFEARRGRLYFDIRVGRNIGLRTPGSLHERTLLVCRLWELENIPFDYHTFQRASTMAHVLQTDLNCLQIPSISERIRTLNTQTLSDLAWEKRKLLYDYHKKDFHSFFKPH